MTTDELNDALDALQAAAADDETLRPGLIEVSVDDWIQSLAEMQTTRPKTSWTAFGFPTSPSPSASGRTRAC